VYELPMLQNNSASETFFYKTGGVRSVSWMFMNGCRPGGDWANTWHWTKRFKIISSNRIWYQPQLVPNHLPYRIPPRVFHSKYKH
jgi:hypothetical protein